MLNEIQEKVWNTLCEMSGEEVTQLFTDIYGTQVLDNPDVVKELKLQGFSFENEEDENDED